VSIVICPLSLPHLERPLEETPVTFVDTPDALHRMVTELQASRHIAIDLENHSFRFVEISPSALHFLPLSPPP